jgi:hypothetical protein
MFVGEAGNVYVTGRSDTTGSADAITIKYDTNGELKWQRRFGTSGVALNAVTVDDDGNVYVTGRDGNAAATVKYDSLGVEQWVDLIDHPLYGEQFVDIVSDGSSIYVFGSRSGLYMTAKYSATGDTAWTRFFSASGGGGLPQPFAITLDDFNNVYVTGRRGTPTSSSNYLTLKYSTFGTFQWSQEYNGPGNSIDEARDIGVDHSGNVYVTGASQGDTTAQDYATIKYGQHGGGGPAECWLTDTFENLSPGSLNGQNEWFTVPGRSDAFVVANPFGAGQVLRMDAGPNETVIMGKYVNIQTAGAHSIKLDVLVDGNPNPAEPTLAKVEIRTTGNPNWDKKFQLYFGAHMRLNYGPTLSDAVEFLSANDLVKGQWYEVEAVVDMSSNTVDIYLDGALKLDDIAVGPGAITDIGISAWDRPGLVYFDNLEFCRTDSIPPGPCFAISTFDFDHENWRIMGDVAGDTIADFIPNGGNPGGYVQAIDQVVGGTMYWQAPEKFLGDVSCAYGQALNFDLVQSRLTSQFDWEDVILKGAGLTLVFDTPYNPDTSWTSYSVPLLETAGWVKDSTINGVISGDPPTMAEMQAVLASLTELRIRAEYVSGADTDGLDNVVLNGAQKGVGPLQCANVVIDDDNPGEIGDGDGRIEGGEFIRIPIALKNTGIETAAGISGTLSTQDPDIFFRNNASAWPDIAAGDTAVSDLSFDFDVAGELGEEKIVTFTLNITASNGGPWVCTFDEVVSPENEPPVVINSIPDTTVFVGDTMEVRDLNIDPAVFHDPDQDLTALTYSATSSDSAKAIAMFTGSILTVAGIDSGLATITVTADDGRGGAAQTDFTVEVEMLTGIIISVPNNLQGAPGDTVDIPVYLTFFGDSVSALGAALKATDNVLTYVSFTEGPIVPGAIFSVNDVTADSIRVGFFDAGSGPIVDHGLLVTLHFLVDPAASSGDTSSLILSDLSASDPLANAIPIQANNGKFTVGSLSIPGTAGEIPREFALDFNYPNPFNPTTNIRYQLSAPARVSLKIYNALGQLVRALVRDNQQQPAGYYQVEWDGRNDFGQKVTSGMYFYRMKAESSSAVFVQTRKMILLK